MPMPTLLLSPDGSRDTSGPIASPAVGDVSTVSGTYGQAWDVSAGGYLAFTAAGRVDPGQGTILLRIVTPALEDVAVLYDANDSGSTHRVFLGSSRALQTRFGGSSSNSGLTVPQDTLAAIGATWQSSGHRGYLNGTPGTLFADTPSPTIHATPRIGQTLTNGFPFPGMIESVLVFDEVLSDTDIATISMASSAWTWDILSPPSAPRPSRVLNRVAKLAALHAGGWL